MHTNITYYSKNHNKCLGLLCVSARGFSVSSLGVDVWEMEVMCYLIHSQAQLMNCLPTWPVLLMISGVSGTIETVSLVGLLSDASADSKASDICN